MTKEEIIKKYDLKLLLLFGSRARGDARKDSDTDIAFMSGRNLDFNQKAELMMDLLPVVKAKETKIDVIDTKTAHPLLLYLIMQDAKVLYTEDMMFFYNLQSAAFKKYIEVKPVYEEMYRRLGEYLVS
ncbi:MAG: nucleotidyltransferase domain-containing protein [Chloroflexota bacterium]